MQHIAELGFGQAVFTNRSITLDVPEYFVATVDDLAGRHGITPEKFMDAILNEGSFEAHLELRAQMNEAAGAKKQNCRRGTEISSMTTRTTCPSRRVVGDGPWSLNTRPGTTLPSRG
jgi:hypothetical protein